MLMAAECAAVGAAAVMRAALVVIASVSALMIAAPVSTAGVAPRLIGPMIVSGPDPLRACSGDFTYAPGWPFEPNVAVNPRDPANVVVGWMQDGTAALMSAATRDGGRTWQRTLMPGLSQCVGDSSYPENSDVWIAFDESGRFVSFSGQAHDNPLGSLSVARVVPGTGTLNVLRSNDGGKSWSKPTAVDKTPVGRYYDDKDAIAADPKVSGRAYLVVPSYQGPTQPGPGGILSWRTDNGGRSWSAPTYVRNNVTSREVRTYSNPIPGVLPNGNVVVSFLSAGVENVLGGTYDVIVARSTDQGRTWSEPVKLGQSSLAVAQDRATGKSIAAGADLQTEAVAPDGSIYVMWAALSAASGTAGSGGFDAADAKMPATTLFFSRSIDGLHWSPARPAIKIPAQVATPALAIAGDGTIGAIYYDTRRNTGKGNQMLADWWLASSHGQGTNWQETHLAGPFDLAPSINSANFTGFPIGLGHYVGLAGMPHGFAAVFPMSGAPAIHGRTDIFFARILTSSGKGRHRARRLRIHRRHREHRQTRP
jgi:hypothetical protein